MGNCQAIDAAALVIQHPGGKIERLYWSVTASEVMRTNPGHYVSLIIPLPPDSSEGEGDGKDGGNKVRFTRVKLLRPTETLTLGHAYRLITSQEVMKVLRAKRCAKVKQQRQKQSSDNNSSQDEEETSNQTRPEASDDTQMSSQRRSRTVPMNTAPLRPKTWRPSLQSIAEAAS
ncbi:hypothetical protein SAY86_019024 [Trapa natans]|uniref:DUF4228 domain-containing protein n=1 Tax=Trapa natans TaxID=22666 RepID=A0AAN7LPG5_TRANT|nr:hypothetical protein SAY86_019024 [Trapa natans]